MARTPISPTPLTRTGFNLTDAEFEVMSPGGEGYGVEFIFDPTDIVVLRNPTDGDAVYTFKVSKESKYTSYGASIADNTITVRAGDTWVRPISNIFKQSDGKTYVDCNVASEILVLSPP